MPSRDVIKVQVVAKLAAVSHIPADKIKEKHRLEVDLGMGPTVRKAMALPYNGIIDDYPSGELISMSAAGDLETVKESIDLVHARANGDQE
jgi:hypothetical protein